MNLFDDVNLNIPRMEQQRYEKIKKSNRYMKPQKDACGYMRV